MRPRRTLLLVPMLIIILLLYSLVLSPTMLLASRDAGAVADSLRERGIPPLLITGLISMIPIFELRGGIPVGIALFKLHPVAVYFTCLLFNLIPVFPILLLLNPLRRLLRDGLQVGALQWALENETPRAAKPSMFGVLLCGCPPSTPTQSLRSSRTINTTSGLVSAARTDKTVAAPASNNDMKTDVLITHFSLLLLQLAF